MIEESEFLAFLGKYHALLRKADKAGAIDGTSDFFVTKALEAEAADLAKEYPAVNLIAGVFRRLEDGHFGNA